MAIEDVYEQLKLLGQVRAGSDFSENWLGMQEGYYRGLRNKQRNPSAKALATCAVRLKRRARMLESSEYHQVQLGATKYDRLADNCVDALLSACASDGSHADR